MTPTADTPDLTDRLLAEGLIGLGKAADLLGGKARKSVRRWCLKGFVVGGRTLKLESILVGGERRTTRAAVTRFLAAQQAGGVPRAPGPCPSAAARVRAAHDRMARKGAARV